MTSYWWSEFTALWKILGYLINFALIGYGGYSLVDDMIRWEWF